MILGLTGNIGSGKSTVSSFFLEMGYKIFDADIIAKNILESEEIKNEIENIFGKEYITDTFEIDKKKLKEEVFSNKEKLKKLNALIHPKVREKFEKVKKEFEKKNELIIFDIPLLFEANFDDLCDKILVVDIEPSIQIERIKNRDSLDREMIEKIINNQMKREEKNSRGDIIVKNNGTVDELEEKIKEIIKIL